MQSLLLSHSRALRLAALRFLNTWLVESSTGTAEVLKHCLQTEEVPLDLQSSRERVHRISRLPVVIKDDDEVGVDAACRWLIAQLKVNLRPLWAAAASALSTLAERFGDLVWRLLFEQLQAVANSTVEVNTPEWLKNDDEEQGDKIWEVERTWKDPSGRRLRQVFAKWHSGKAAKKAVAQSQRSDDRFDSASYETQLLLVLRECPSLAERHSRDLIPHFLSLTGPDASTKLPRYKLSAWLTLFSKFMNPKALRSSDTMHALYVSLLSHPDRSLQRLALSCLLTYKSPHLTSHEDILLALLDDTRWRDALTQLEIAEIESADRPELISTIIRLLFGLMLERRGRSQGTDRRAAVLAAFAGCTDDELHLLVDLMLQPISGDVVDSGEQGFAIRAIPAEVSEKQQIGFLTLLGDVLKHLGSRLIARWPVLLQTLLNLANHAQRRIDARHSTATIDETVEIEDEGEDVDEAEGSSRNVRTVRQLSVKRLADFFRCPVSYDFTTYMREAFPAIISPRLEHLDRENTQAPSALLELFYVWTTQKEYAHILVDYDERTLAKIYACLIATNVKAAVVSKVYDIVDNILSLSVEDEKCGDTLLKPYVSLLLTNISILVERSKGFTNAADTLGKRQIGILSQVAPYLTDAAQASMLLELFQPLMRKPTNIVPEKVKTELATIMCSLFPLIPQLSDSTSSAYVKAYTSLSQLFQTLRSRQARLSLIAAFRSLASANTAISALSELMDSLNAYSAKRIDEPNFDRRLAAFTSLNEELYASLSRDDWLPILYNMFNFIQDPTELSIRSNAAFTMKRFIETVANSEDARYEATFMKIFYPGIKNGLRSKNEMVRSEILGVLSYAISQCRRINALQEMQVLLANGDDEASFFNNIHHVQLHRRTRAIRRLGEHCIEGRLHSTVLADIFIPLIGNFIVSGDSVDHTLVNEAITATGRMAGQLKWSAYYSLTQNYLRLSTNKDTSERIHIRALVAILDNFHFTMDEVVEGEEDAGGTITGDGQDETVVDELPTEPRPATAKPSETSRIADAVNLRLLPKLLEHLERRDEAEDSLRIPIAVGVVQVAKHLPTTTREPQISRLLTVLSQVFRSKSQETRDMTRETLCRIAIILGPTYLPLILRELRAALLRGPHLHVLAFVTHALLVHVTTGAHAEQFGILDGCVNDVAHVSAEVIFGESGKDVQSDGFKTKMREVRLSAAKGLDSFAITAQYITPSKISNLLLPIRNILRETESLKILQQIDDLLRRIAGGLNANKHLVPAELLVLCHTLISQNARFLQDAPKPRETGSKDRRDAIVQTKRKIDSEADHYANNSFRFVSFGLDLFITAHRRSRFDFQDPQIISRLEPMVTTIGNTLYSNRMEVVIPGLKAAAAIVKCPLKSIDEALPVFILQIMDIIRQAGTTESEGVQAAFKSLATILRDRADAQVREKDLVFLLELFSPDLEEPSRQASVFAMLRAIVARKFVAPEIYDMMDKITEIMVTNQSPRVQELCRGVLLQFLLDYPQGKGRLRDQMTVLAKNLSYVYESGRKSVMEFLSAIIAKFQVGVIREYADLLFVALVMVVANDDSPKCREMALELIKSLFSRLNDTQRKVTMSQLHGWAAQYDKPQLTRVSLQVYGVIVDLAQQDISPYIPTILDDANGALQHSAGVLAAAEAAAEGGDVAEENLDWQLSYHALVLCSKILRVSPELTTRSDKISWPSVTAHLVFPHGWTRTASCRLLGVLFAATPAAAPSIKLPADSPLSRAGMEDVARKLCVQLQSPNLDAPLSLQIVKNLFYVGKCFAAIEMPASAEQAVAEEVDGEEINAAAAEEDEGPSDAEDDKERHPLPWLFTKLSYQARHAHIARRNKSNNPANWVHQPASVFKWFAAMVSYLESSLAERFLVHILSPLYRIAEDDIIRDTQIGELKTLAIELQDLVQAKVGTTAFAGVYNRIRQGVLGVRRERRNARAVQTATNPGAAAKRKLQQNALKKESRKRKNQAFAGGKGRPKRRREA
ncbi:hypothetical protein WOLCODRAFT_125908 [Wolfiporia cocos MD-104 SS10]|uniref:Uncharacterized protein n=1 Tax=Wolfiporia cocos (strain MD-104) TaxID=742152 RepID=A0A2H3JCV3_WOLCO|nr:hypothetical protein WOLCODRAFT_125908 [Wolfiporia cocos MD-104 SS10]